MKKVIVCDLDGTLTESKSPLSPEMADSISKVLHVRQFAIISGGSYAQFQKQFLSHLSADKEVLKNLYLFPTNGSRCYVYDEGVQDWKILYAEDLTEDEKKKIILSLETAIRESGVDVSNPYGELIEDRSSQISFSGRGQEAPLEIKSVWDPDKTKRQKIVSILEQYIPEFEMRINANSTIDITHKGIDKAYAIRKIEALLKVNKEDIIFIGDAIFPGGNDWAAKESGVECVQVSGTAETQHILNSFTQEMFTL